MKAHLCCQAVEHWHCISCKKQERLLKCLLVNPELCKSQAKVTGPLSHRFIADTTKSWKPEPQRFCLQVLPEVVSYPNPHILIKWGKRKPLSCWAGWEDKNKKQRKQYLASRLSCLFLNTQEYTPSSFLGPSLVASLTDSWTNWKNPIVKVSKDK